MSATISTLTTATLATHTSNSFHTLALEVAAFTLAITKENPEITAVEVARQFSEQNGVAVTTPTKKPRAASTRGTSRKDQVSEFLISKDDALGMVGSGDFTSKCLYLFNLGVHAGNVCGAPLQDSTAETAETAVCAACAQRKRPNPLTAPTKEEKAAAKKTERAVSAEKKNASKQKHSMTLTTTVSLDRFREFAAKRLPPNSLVLQPGVLEWATMPKGGHTSKATEDAWGKQVVARATGKTLKQWTTYLSEKLVAECLELDGEKIITMQPVAATSGHRLDIETENYIVESKSGAYHTPGTAHEKISGACYKYLDVAAEVGKPLRIIVSGKAEEFASTAGRGGGTLIPTADTIGKFSHARLEMIERWSASGITIVRLSSIISSIAIKMTSEMA